MLQASFRFFFRSCFIGSRGVHVHACTQIKTVTTTISGLQLRYYARWANVSTQRNELKFCKKPGKWHWKWHRYLARGPKHHFCICAKLQGSRSSQRVKFPRMYFSFLQWICANFSISFSRKSFFLFVPVISKKKLQTLLQNLCVIRWSDAVAKFAGIQWSQLVQNRGDTCRQQRRDDAFTVLLQASLKSTLHSPKFLCTRLVLMEFDLQVFPHIHVLQIILLPWLWPHQSNTKNFQTCLVLLCQHALCANVRTVSFKASYVCFNA